MLENIFSQYNYAMPFILRFALAFVLIRHGWPKLFGPQPGLRGFSDWLGSIGFPIPMFWAIIVALLETIGSVGLILGIFTRFIALLVAIQFFVIMLTIKQKNDWGEKELDLLIFATALALVFSGSGYMSLNYFLEF